MEEDFFGEDYQPVSSFWVSWFECLNNIKTFSRIRHFKTHGKSLLEIGVGSGSLLSKARSKGYEVAGCDLSTHICQQVRSLYGITMFNLPIQSLPSDNRYDIVVMNHVLEHVSFPLEFLRHVFRLLAPGGVVHIAVPNVACLESILRGWNSFESYHLAYFNAETLDKVISDSGLEPKIIKTTESFSGWFLSILRTIVGVNSKEGLTVHRPKDFKVNHDQYRRSIAVEHAYRMSMVFAGLISWPFRYLQGRVGRGDELICIARKPVETFSVDSHV